MTHKHLIISLLLENLPMIISSCLPKVLSLVGWKGFNKLINVLLNKPKLHGYKSCLKNYIITDLNFYYFICIKECKLV